MPSAPAIINAVCDATGLDIHDLPYRPIKAEGGIRRLHTTEGCVFCGLCAKKCPYGALSVDRQTKQWRVSGPAVPGMRPVCGSLSKALPFLRQ